MASLLMEQQEKLRRVVDDGRFRAQGLLSDLHASPSSSSSAADPVRVHVEPVERSDLPALLGSDNVAVSKFLTVLSHDCLQISRLSQFASRNLYRQLLLFGHRSSPHEVLLEGEPQKAFGQSLSLFIELYETVSETTVVLGNLLQQLNAIYSLHDNVRPLNSFKSFNFRTVFESFGDGLAIFLVLDEIVKENNNIKSYLALYARMLNKVKTEANNFVMIIEDLDLLDQVVGNLEKLFEFGFFKRLTQMESPWQASLNLVRCNKKFLDACCSCFHDSLSELLLRIDSWKELPFDRRKILHNVALLLFSVHVSAEALDKKYGKLIMVVFQSVPVVYVEGGKRIILFDVLKSQCPQALSSWSPLREASKDLVLMKRNYLKRLSEMHSRDWQAIKDALSCWAVSFQSIVHPSSEILSEEWVRLLMKQIMQGAVLADRLHMLVLSMLDLHALLEIPLRKEKVKSLCHMIVSLKIIGDIFEMKGPGIIRSLPHVINIIQADIEQFILPFKSKLQYEIAKWSQATKMGFLSSLTRGGKEMDTKLTDSLSLVLVSLQLLEAGGSYKRQLLFSITMDVLQSIGHLDIDFSRIQKSMSKLRIVTDFQTIIEEKTNCSFLYWRKEMLGTWLSTIYVDARNFSWLQYILDAFSDGLSLLKLSHVGKLTLQSYEKEIENALICEIIAPLCKDIETDLRLHVHSTRLRGSVFVNPTRTGVRNLSWYLMVNPLRLPFKLIDVKLLVESYLNSAFYSHSVMSAYDGRVYAEMRQLGELKYGLELDDCYLSGYFGDQNFDISKVVENPNTFVDGYSYNMFNQMFIENGPDNQGRKNLKVIGVEHVATSLARHGLRPISVASNSVTMFLNQMFTALSELIQGDCETGALKESYISKQQELKFSLGKLAIGNHGVTLLEQIHFVITRIGNALGLVRTLLVGCSRYCCNSLWYTKGSTSDLNFSETCKILGLSDETVMVGRMLDTCITNNKCRLDDTIKPFSSLIAIFSEKLQLSELRELKDFFLIIPSLIANLVDCRVLRKDKLVRGDHEPGSIVSINDGLIMGTAFVLKVLGQEESFDKLNWFSSAKKKLREEITLPEESCESQEEKKGWSNLAGLTRWLQAPPITTEAHKGVDKRKRYRDEIELIECSLKFARTLLSS
ncbi:WASH complex subunit SWIP-like isoform X3 [Ananas comosus]|uniref:WASH complex subunit SWIP-like isoform X3 n=1 Tax=Ananas comosus TaxID=4615 RepID=A0A6P5H3E8_ANACO|nr:WASH complex subunit SWIP-like isoform X3 [Ananas comosus]